MDISREPKIVRLQRLKNGTNDTLTHLASSLGYTPVAHFRLYKHTA